MIVDKEKYEQLLTKMDNIPFTQTLEWNNENLLKGIFLVDIENNPSIMCFAQTSKHRLLGTTLIIDGVCTRNDITIKQLTDFFKSLISSNYNVIKISDISEYSADFEVAIRRSGFIRPLGLTLCPMSMIVNLQEDFKFHRNWKRNVKKSLESGCVFVPIDEPSINDVECFIKLFNELSERKHLGFSLNNNQLLELLKGSYKLFFIKNSQGENICGRIEYTCQNLVYDVYAANSDEAIRLGAAYYIQESIFNYYRDKGLERFDYGRISPSSDHMDAIYVAKSYSGGIPISYNGQWVYSKSLLVNYFYSFLNFVIRKIHIY